MGCRMPSSWQRDPATGFPGVSGGPCLGILTAVSPGWCRIGTSRRGCFLPGAALSILLRALPGALLPASKSRSAWPSCNVTFVASAAGRPPPWRFIVADFVHRRGPASSSGAGPTAKRGAAVVLQKSQCQPLFSDSHSRRARWRTIPHLPDFQTSRPTSRVAAGRPRVRGRRMAVVIVPSAVGEPWLVSLAGHQAIRHARPAAMPPPFRLRYVVR